MNKEEILELTRQALAIGVSAFKYGDNLKEELIFNIAVSKLNEIKIDDSTDPKAPLAYVGLSRKGINLYLNPFKILDTYKYVYEDIQDLEERRNIMLAILRGVLKHEMLHVMLKHLINYPKRSNHMLANIVQDAIINSYIKEFEYLNLRVSTPEKSLEIQTNNKDDLILIPAKFDTQKINNKVPGIFMLSKHAYYSDFTWEEYYDYLKDKLPQETIVDLSLSYDNGSNNSDSEDSQSQSNSSSDGSETSNGIGNNIKKNNPLIGDTKPCNPSEIGEQTLGELDNLIKEVIERTKGTKLGNLVEEIYIKTKKKEAISWRNILKKSFANGSRIIRKYSIKRFDRRFDIPPGPKMKYVGGIVRVLIDSSGSVSSKEIEEFLSELYILSKKYGYQVDGYFYDYGLQNHFTEKDIKKKRLHVEGRGGTSVLKALKQLDQSKKAKIMIIATDGHDSPPKREDINAEKVVFLLTKKHSNIFKTTVSKYAIVGVINNDD